jgi:cyclopropane-fatty-acyl-phospholipid synthase
LAINNIIISKKNISFHYNKGNDLYTKMLGKYMQYTCAYFNKPNMTLDEAQLNKMKLIAKKLNLKPGMKVLDIGCGFGSLGYYLANEYNVNVTGVTLSEEQKNMRINIINTLI